MKNYIYENHDVEGLQITEASTEQLQEGVLAKVKGPSFFLDGYSRNGRFYPKKLWENALKNGETKEALRRGLMFGCIGHPKDYSLDELLESGKVSHKVTNIFVDEKSGEGIAEYEILDTPSGRILNTVLRSGSDMYVSTRAFGGFTNETKNKDGKKYKILDHKNFVIESIDFVIQPGFLETKPKLMEALSEDFAELREKDIKNHIECEDGLCSMKLPESLKEVQITEKNDKKDILEKDTKESKGTNVNNEQDTKQTSKENPHFNRDLLEKLSKEDIITMLENVLNENKILTGVAEEDTNGDMMVSAKLMKNYVSYVELLTKLVRYNVEYEKHYDSLIEFLDKDSKLTTNDMSSLDDICNEILKEKDVEESIIKTCERIRELSEKINSSDGKDSSDTSDSDNSGEEDNSGEVKVGESFVDFMLEMKTKTIEKIEMVQDEELVRELNGQLIQMKEATKFLTKKLDEEMSKDAEKIVETKTEIEYRVPDDITEKVKGLNSEIESLQEDKKTFEESKLQMIETIEAKDTEIAKIQELFSELKYELKSIKEKEEDDKATFREILEDKAEELSSLQEKLDNAQSKYELVSNGKEVVEKKVRKLGDELYETKAKYYASMYRVELHEVKKIMETSSNEDELKEALHKKEKFVKRNESKVIEVPEYKPSSRRNQEKSAFLEKLTR